MGGGKHGLDELQGTRTSTWAPSVSRVFSSSNIFTTKENYSQLTISVQLEASASYTADDTKRPDVHGCIYADY
jgi:hypothetical protein